MHVDVRVTLWMAANCQLWHLSIEFYGEWQLFATHHRTQYLTKFDDL